MRPVVGETIILVEDDGSMARAMQAALVASGYIVRAASTCADGLALALDQMPDLLVVDIGLPDGTGWSLLESIRQARPGMRLPVIATSSNTVTRADIREHGVNSFISKPFDMMYFADTVRQVLANAR